MFTFLFLFFWQYWGLNSGLALAGQALYHLSQAPSPFLHAIFQTVAHNFPFFPSFFINDSKYTKI
jgi:hypothetical protein